jgi:hypothetical protein
MSNTQQIPKRIFLQVFGEDEVDLDNPYCDGEEITWSAERINDSDIEYERASLCNQGAALTAEKIRDEWERSWFTAIEVANGDWGTTDEDHEAQKEAAWQRFAVMMGLVCGKESR